MIKSLPRVAAVFIAVTAIVSLLVSPAAAHRMIMEKEGDFFIVRYDDKTPAQGARVTFFDKEGNELLIEETGRDGRIKVPAIRFARAQADDGLGHRAFYEPGQTVSTIPRPLAAALGISFFLFVASLANYLNKRKNSPLKEEI
jgi:hypothetical protein